jgi:hypothetical protein
MRISASTALRSALIFSLCLWLAQEIEAATEHVPRCIYAVRSHSPKIDGKFEADWLAAAPADSFTQIEPVEGAPGSMPTKAYTLYDDDALYFCFVCADSAPDSINARILRRDNDANCDYVALGFDSFHDRRNGYWMGVTAAGGQMDGTVANETSFDDAWDGVWQSAVGRTDSGWIAEFRIPFTCFRHGGAREDGWGINFVRHIERRKEDQAWQPVSWKRGVSVSEFGNLLGLQDIGSAEHVEILPHAVGRWDAPADGKWGAKNDYENLGLFMKFVPSAEWTVDLAYQPDFAQVDVDEEVINISDYPVFLTEKRPFFLEAKTLFDSSPIQLLYTRRIADPDYGGKLNGQWGPLCASVLAARNRDEDGNPQDAAAGRTVWNVGKQSTIGMTGTFLNAQDTFHAAAADIDTRIRWGADNSLKLTFAGVERTGNDAQPFEARGSLFMDLGFLRGSAVSAYRGQDYNINDLGWGPYSNTLEHYLWVGKQWQFKSGLLQCAEFNLNGWRSSIADGRFGAGGGNWNGYIRTRGNLEFSSGMNWCTLYRRHYADEDEGETGELRDNFGSFNPEFHPNTDRWIWFESDDRKPIVYSVEGSEGTFREGRYWQANQSATVKPRANLETGLRLAWMRIWGAADVNDYQPTDYRIWRWRVRYSVTLDFSLRGTVQWVEEDDELLTNLLLAWNWHPGSWFYIVYDETRPTIPLASNNPGDRTIRLKLTYFFTMRGIIPGIHS